MALGSLATATKASPSPTARAPTPIFKNWPDVVPARCSPSASCAEAGAAAAASVSSARASGASLEVIVELEPVLGARAEVRGVVHVSLEVVEVGRERRVLDRIGIDVRAHARRRRLAGDAVDDLHDAVVEDV